MKLLIEVNPQTGACQVQGPVDNKLLAYGMLEVARDAIDKHHAMKANGSVQPASAIQLDAIDRIKGG